MSAQHPSSEPAATHAHGHGAAPASGYSKHRIEGLTDGIYAVAMTLLAIELKLPETVSITTGDELAVQLRHLVPHFISWPLSFAILGIFWFSHQRAFRYLRAVDGGVTTINLISLGFVTLLPFSTMLIGAYPTLFAPHAIYGANMIALSLISIWQVRYIRRHPELTNEALSKQFVDGANFRCWALVACAVLAIVVAWFVPRFASMAYMAMALIAPLSRRWAHPAARPG
jgi:uncharacterized membrane protein